MIVVLTHRIPLEGEAKRRYVLAVEWAAHECGVMTLTQDHDPEGLEQLIGGVGAVPHVPSLYRGGFLQWLHDTGMVEAEQPEGARA